MITEAEMYWLTRLTYLQGFLLAIGGLGLALAGMAFVIATADDLRKRPAIVCGVLSMLMLLGSMFIPTTKEMCAIKAIPVIVNNEQVQGLPNKVVELANEWIEELKPSKDNE